jgi:hypothetical protein
LEARRQLMVAVDNLSLANSDSGSGAGLREMLLQLDDAIAQIKE